MTFDLSAAAAQLDVESATSLLVALERQLVGRVHSLPLRLQCAAGGGVDLAVAVVVLRVVAGAVPQPLLTEEQQMMLAVEAKRRGGLLFNVGSQGLYCGDV